MKSSSPQAPKASLNQKRRQHLRRKAFRLFATIGVFVALVAVWVLPIWQYSGEINIKGNRWVSTDTIRAAINPPQEPMFRMDPLILKQQVQTIPQVERVDVRRWLFPARLEVRIKERTPVARIASQSIYLDADGILFSAPIQPVPLTVLLPASYQGESAEAFRVLYREWPPKTPGLLDLRKKDDIKVSLGGLTARFGIAEEIPSKFRAFFRLRPLAKRYGDALEYLDLRFPDSPTLKCKATPLPCKETGNSPLP